MSRHFRVRTIERLASFRRNGITFTEEPQDVDASGWTEAMIANLLDTPALYVEEHGRLVGAHARAPSAARATHDAPPAAPRAADADTPPPRPTRDRSK